VTDFYDTTKRETRCRSKCSEPEHLQREAEFIQGGAPQKLYRD
jgi:hypothetical protein